ncbi:MULTISPECIES: ATP-binding protein [Brevibacillus]|uniref:Histidine kinase/HSP90-like ATPase domain-containing protein n=2 Tax=Brevibacillus parabrevis TaxID=54914 RepID=A0A4Y3PE44_BREPA|nr:MULTISPECIES: ATP-binding protein [Brevibacillus]NRQ55621.1 ATP-binding protein [Brevibacillus sp. HD1.4A]MBU8714775.1 ATP-binding protein [Brevibacillus parabrevis]MDH6348737.1 anti-sigma regulatory factor (Ser/Thr protein kinase) [Brevibacillus sp. 1238]MDR5000632.1 ATP-binding protein [Brevibacillus parabrevis]MED1725183.1 ATP-binding protein [Brevibacillus parabrevis]
MILCEQCPDNPSCRNCLLELRSGGSAQKVLPPRKVKVTELATMETSQAQLIAVSRTAIGLLSPSKQLHGRMEVELAFDFRIIGSGLQGINGVPYYVVDIEKVLRKEEVLERLLLEEFHTWHLRGELDPTDVLTNWKDRDDERGRLIKQELQKLSILRQIESIFLYLFDDGNIRPLGSSRADPDVETQMQRLINEAAVRGAGESLREQIVSGDGKKVFEMYVSDLPDRTCGIALIDVTAAIAEERMRKRREWEIYRDILGVVTAGKLLLLSDEELFFLLREGRKSLAMDIKEPGDLALLRRAFKRALEPLGLVANRLLQFLVAVNEAASNTLKHGSGGTITLYIANDLGLCRVVIHDQGQGILLEDLPRATLQQGFSTRNSLGAGFHVMLQYCDRIYLSSTAQGTKLILESALPS